METINKIKGYRTMSGLTQEEMAKELNMSTQSYMLKETGKREFTHSEMTNFVKVIQTVDPMITMDDIFMD
jgi:putative transcriptional regulator